MHESLQLYDVQSCASYFGYGSQWAFLSYSLMEKVKLVNTISVSGSLKIQIDTLNQNLFR